MFCDVQYTNTKVVALLEGGSKLQEYHEDGDYGG